MRNTWVVVVAACAAWWIAGAGVFAEDPPHKPGAPTAARPTAEVAFAALRKAAADHDEPTLVACLPTKLVSGWPTDAADDAKKWRADLAARIADGTVVFVHESGDSAIARWKTAAPDAVWELRMKYEGGRWIASAPWAYCVGGAELTKANGRGAAHVKLKARTSVDVYGPSAFSFVNVTQNPKQCLNRMDLFYCRCGQFHGRGGNMFSMLKAKSVDEVDGIQTGGDWMDEIVPRANAVYVFACKQDGRRDFQVALQITALTSDALEFDWRLVAAGKNAPANIRTPQPLVSNDGADGTDALCDKRGK